MNNAMQELNSMVRADAQAFDVHTILDVCARKTRSALRKHGVVVPRYGLPATSGYVPIEVRRLIKILQRVRDVRIWIDREHPDAKRFLARYALDLGRLAFAAAINFEPLAWDAAEHQKTRTGGAQGGRQKAANQRAQNIERNGGIALRGAELKREHPEWKKHAIAKQIVRESKAAFSVKTAERHLPA